MTLEKEAKTRKSSTNSEESEMLQDCKNDLSFPDFVLFTKRKESYESFPQLFLDPVELAKAGFFYTGMHIKVFDKFSDIKR